MTEAVTEANLEQALEALLFISDEPVGTLTLAEATGFEPTKVENALDALAAHLEESGRGIRLQRVAGGWRLYTAEEFHELLESYVLSWDTRRMSQAALEVLAIVAYGQPMTRAQVSDVRGVSSDSAMNTLLDRGYLREAGVDDAPGNPVLYATSHVFLEHFGLNSVEDLPPLEDFAPDEETIARIRERLGSIGTNAVGVDAVANAEQMIAEAQGALLGTVEKIDFSKLNFNTDDE